jgi:hypothetical protein
MDMYYGMRVNTTGPAAQAYLYVTLLTNGDFDGAAVTVIPSGIHTTWFSYQDKSVQMQLPPTSSVSAGITVVTGSQNIAGTLGISPPIVSDVVLNLYGAGSSPIGSITLEAGQTSIPFDFSVQPEQGLGSEAKASSFLENAEPKPA